VPMMATIRSCGLFRARWSGLTPDLFTAQWQVVNLEERN
jgi:hypothetical protein